MRHYLDTFSLLARRHQTERSFAWVPLTRDDGGAAQRRRRKQSVAQLLAAVAVTLIAAAALTAKPVRGETSWTQAYVGVGPAADVILEDVVTTLSEALHGGNVGASVVAGADVQLSNLVVAGVFANYGLGNTGSELSLRVDGFDLDLNSQSLRVEHSIAVGARAGVLLTPNTLVYGMVGHSWLQLNDTVASLSGQTVRLAQPRFKGVTFGAGFEHRLGPHLSVRSEYSFTSLGRATDLVAPSIVQTEPEKRIHGGRIALALRLGGTETSEHDAHGDGVDDRVAGAADFSGLNVAIGAGLNATTHDLSFNLIGAGLATLDGVGGSNASGTAGAGYDWRLAPNWLVGVLGRIGWSNHSRDLRLTVADVDVAVDTLTVARTWTAAARIGYQAAPRSLLYGLIGHSWVRYHEAALVTDLAGVGFDLPVLKGISVGAGFEHQIIAGLSLRGEYVFTALKRQRVANDLELLDVTLDPDLHALQLALAYRF